MTRKHLFYCLLVCLLFPLTACATTAYTASGKTYTITKTISSDTRIGDNCTLIFKAGGQFRNCRVTARNLRIVPNGTQTAFSNVTFSGNVVNSKLYATNFGARADMRDVVKNNWSFKGNPKMKITARTGYDNDPAWERLSAFLSNSNGVELEFNGAFYSELSKSMNIENASNLTLHGGTLIKGINIIDCTNVLIYGINLVGFHHAHDFPPIVDSKTNAQKGITVAGKTYNLSNSYCTQLDKMKDIGIAGDAINCYSKTPGRKCENITIRDCHVEMRQDGIFAGQRSASLITQRINVSNCTINNIYYQPIGLHCQYATYDNITASYCLQPIDFSTCANNCTVTNSKFYNCCKGPKQESTSKFFDMSFNNKIDNCYIQINENYFMADASMFILSVSQGKPGDTFQVSNTQFVVNKRLQSIDGFYCRANRLLMNNVNITINSSVPNGKNYGMMRFFAVGGGTPFSPIIECNGLNITSNLKCENFATVATGTVGPDKLQLKFNDCTFNGTAQFATMFASVGSVEATRCKFNLKTNYFIQSTPKVNLNGSAINNVSNTAIIVRGINKFDCDINNCDINVAQQLISVTDTDFKINMQNNNVTSSAVVTLNDGLKSRGLTVKNNQINITGNTAFSGLKKSHKNMFGSNGFNVESNTFNASSGADVIPAEAKSAFSTVNRKNTFRGRAR